MMGTNYPRDSATGPQGSITGRKRGAEQKIDAGIKLVSRERARAIDAPPEAQQGLAALEHFSSSERADSARIRNEKHPQTGGSAAVRTGPAITGRSGGVAYRGPRLLASTVRRRCGAAHVEPAAPGGSLGRTLDRRDLRRPCRRAISDSGDPLPRGGRCRIA